VDVEPLIREMYSKLFALPQEKILAIVYVIATLAIALLDYLWTEDLYVFPRIFVASVFYLALIYLVFHVLSPNPMGFKRLLGVADFSLAPYVIIWIFLYPFEKSIYLVYASSSGMLFLLRYIFWGNLFLSQIIAILIGIAASMISSSGDLIIILKRSFLTSLVSTLVMTAFVLFIELIGKRNGVKTFKLGRGFIKTWIFDDTKDLENVLEENSIKKDIKIKIMIFRRKVRDVLLIFPGFHFGPFKKAGSSDAVYIFDEALKDVGDTLVFHTIGSHENNIVRRSYVKNIAEVLRKDLSDHDDKNIDHRLVKVATLRTNDHWMIYVFYSEEKDCVSTIFVNEEGSDDVPEREMTDIIEYADKKSVKIMFADAHSFYGRRSLSYESLKRSLRKIIDAEDIKMSVVKRMGFGSAYMRHSCGGVCNGLIKALIIETSDGKDLLIYIYGNNMIKSTNDFIRRYFREKGFREVLIVTPDDHSCAATSVGDPYTAVRLCDELLKTIERAVSEAEKDLSEYSVYCFEKSFDKIPVMGESVWSYIKSVEVLGPITPRLWMLFLLISGVLSVLIKI